MNNTVPNTRLDVGPCLLLLLLLPLCCQLKCAPFECENKGGGGRGGGGVGGLSRLNYHFFPPLFVLAAESAALYFAPATLTASRYRNAVVNSRLEQREREANESASVRAATVV